MSVGAVGPGAAPLDVPSSRDAAVAAAAAAVAVLLSDGTAHPPSKPRGEPSRGKKKGKPAAAPKGFAPASALRCVIELPLADDTPAASAALAVDLLDQLPASLVGAAVVAFGSVDAALAASDSLTQPVSVVSDGEDDDTPDVSPTAWLLLVAPPADADRAVRATLAAAKGRPVVLVNAPIDVLSSPPPPYGRGWTPAYVFQPIAIQGFLGATTSGTVLCAADARGAPPAWFILDSKNSLIGRAQRRPTPTDLEDAFYNAAAVASPLTKAAARLKGIADGLRGKK